MDGSFIFRSLCITSIISLPLILLIFWFFWYRPQTGRKHRRELEAHRIISEMRQREEARQFEIMSHEHEWGSQVCHTLIDQQISLGMNTMQVVLSWGQPKYVDQHEITADTENIRWIYGERWYKPNYVYFTNGKVSKIRISS